MAEAVCVEILVVGEVDLEGNRLNQGLQKHAVFTEGLFAAGMCMLLTRGPWPSSSCSSYISLG